MRKYGIVCYMKIECESNEITDTPEELFETLDHLQEMCPENIYRIEETEEDNTPKPLSLDYPMGKK